MHHQRPPAEIRAQVRQQRSEPARVKLAGVVHAGALRHALVPRRDERFSRREPCVLEYLGGHTGAGAKQTTPQAVQ